LSTNLPEIVVLYKGKKHFVVGAKNVGKDLVYDLRLPGMLPSDGVIKADSREIVFGGLGNDVEEPDIVYF
jgi:hypothetical protein